MNTYRLWQIKKNGQISGPFPENLIVQHILLGRIRSEDQISLDGHFWQSFEGFPEIVAQIQQLSEGGDSQWREERYRASLRHLDERKRPDPRKRETPQGSTSGAVPRTGVDRRKAPETVAQHTYRESIAEVDHWLTNYRPGKSVMVVVLFGIVVLTGLAIHHFGTEAPPIDLGLRAATCDSPPSGRVDWHGCDKSGYVLAGADLHDADLRGVRFTGANLAYANLKGARLGGASFDGANLVGVTWVNGRLCAANSVGVCR